MSVGKNIKLFRINAGLKQKELAEKLGKKAQYINAIENEKKEPSLSLLKEIAHVLKVPISMFFWEDTAKLGKNSRIGKLQQLLFEFASDLQSYEKPKKARS
jgi:transcriptional regulator with XRE-family HTH domain